MSTLKAIQKAPWDREEELSQLRQLCLQQHEALKFLLEAEKLDDDDAVLANARNDAAKSIEKYTKVMGNE